MMPSAIAAPVRALLAVVPSGIVSHVGFVQDGRPFVIPMIYGREEEVLFFHDAGT